MQAINIDGTSYAVLDAQEYMTIPDCFVAQSNKIGSGHGEAKFYVGNESKETLVFFDDFTRPCLLLKDDFQKYMEDAKLEYTEPEQEYVRKDKLPAKWPERMSRISSIKNNIIHFSIFRVKVSPPRIYINSNDRAYCLIREIALPQISYLSALKIRHPDGEVFYYFKLFLDYFGKDNHPSVIRKEEGAIEESGIKPTEKKAMIKARIGQGEYRTKLLNECNTCIVTGVTDERLIIASHIKPWVKSDDSEKTDPKNGLPLTPTYDALFDKGFISFESDGTMLISPWISPMNQKRLSLSPRKTYKVPSHGR